MLKEDQQLKKQGALHWLTPSIDEEGLLRVSERVVQSEVPEEIKHPIILPKNRRPLPSSSNQRTDQWKLPWFATSLQIIFPVVFFVDEKTTQDGQTTSWSDEEAPPFT